MSFDDLLQTRAIEPAHASATEIAGLLAVARRDIRTAQSLVSTDLDWAFAIAYNAILQVSIAYMGHLGFRPRGEGKHFNTFRFMEQALPTQTAMIGRLQRLRRKRNTTVYEQAGAVSEKEGREIVVFASEYYRHVSTLLPPGTADDSEEDQQ